MTSVGSSKSLESTRADIAVIPVRSGGKLVLGGEKLSAPLRKSIDRAMKRDEFTGEAGSTVELAAPEDSNLERVLLVGLGDKPDTEVIRQAGGLAGRAGAGRDVVVTTFHGVKNGAAPFAEGFLLGQYRFDKYKAKKGKSASRSLKFAGDGGRAASTEAKRSIILAEAVNQARDLQNEPSGAKPPAVIANQAVKMARSLGLKTRVYTDKEFKDERFGGLMGVAAGSHRPARMLVLRHEPKSPKATVALVGKGIVFDSGGLSLKPPSGMETMKTDMSGAANVIAAMGAIAKLNPQVRVIAVCPLTENMPGGNATRPGDVLTARNGTTMEVLNTDAEGRLVLADALALAAESKPDIIVDQATLTGACKVALGGKIAGLFGNDADAIERVKKAAERAGEAVWHMPMPDYYRKNIDSDIADIKNTGSRWGGAINAAFFLKEFVGDVPWTHLDIAGPARWDEDEHYQVKGGSGFGVRTLVTLVESFDD